MRIAQWMSAGVRKGIVVTLALALSGALTAFAATDSSPRVMAQASGRLESSVFSYDGKDFVRTQTTLVTETGKSAVGTKLEHDAPAYTALVAKHSYTGETTVFGKKYDANYAPLTGKDGNLTGALFVGLAK